MKTHYIFSRPLAERFPSTLYNPYLLQVLLLVTVNSKSFVGKILLHIKWKFELQFNPIVLPFDVC